MLLLVPRLSFSVEPILFSVGQDPTLLLAVVSVEEQGIPSVEEQGAPVPLPEQVWVSIGGVYVQVGHKHHQGGGEVVCGGAVLPAGRLVPVVEEKGLKDGTEGTEQLQSGPLQTWFPLLSLSHPASVVLIS